MNLPRLVLAAVVAWFAFVVFDAVVAGALLTELYEAHRGILRPAEEANRALEVVLALVGFFAFAYAYVKGYEGGSGLWEGLRYGVIVAIMLVAFGVSWVYVTFPISARLAIARVVATMVEFSVYGVIVGVLYRPLPARA